MKYLSTVLSIMFLFLLASLSAQTYVIDEFDSAATDAHYQTNVEGVPSYMELTDNLTDYVSGEGALDVNYVIGEFHGWGSYANLIYRTDSTETMDWSISDSLSIWIKVRNAPTYPEYMVFRIHIADRPNPDDDIEEYIYENALTLDAQTDWFELKVPLIERETDGSIIPNDEGFVLFPNSWGGGTYNNRMLDRDKIIGYNLSAVVSGWDPDKNLPADSVQISYDHFTRYGSRAVPFVIFNGMTVPKLWNMWSWGQSSIALEEGAGATEGTNALKWVQGDEYGNGWTGFGFDVVPSTGLLGSWMTDSVKFKMKAQSGTGTLRMQFESGDDGKVGITFDPIADDAWHNYALALRDMVYQDGTANFDTAAVNKVGIMAEASGVAGNVIYIDDWWTGNPSFDVVPPKAPTGLSVAPGDYYNLVIWEDAAGETGETYNVYASSEPITDLASAKVEPVALGVEEGAQSAYHKIYYPLKDKNVSNYYAVICQDAAGNRSTLATTGPVTNLAKAMATISLNPPSNFAADGDPSEWYASGIMPYEFKASTSHWAIGLFDDDNDLSANAFIAVDADNIYFAFDVIDDVYSYDPEGDWWQDDVVEVYLGLYHSIAKHSSFERGEEPDYKFEFLSNAFIHEFRQGGYQLYQNETENYRFLDYGASDYVIEAKIPLDSVKFGDDVRFNAVNGMRIPMDIIFHDADNTVNVRDGALSFSDFNNDNSYQSPVNWGYTWVGDTALVVGIKDKPVNVV
ncbi:MAG: sugar-binding protein, partial [Calditrichia bacterium]